MILKKFTHFFPNCGIEPYFVLVEHIKCSGYMTQNEKFKGFEY